MSITLKIKNLRGNEIAPLYNRYPGQITAQGAYCPQWALALLGTIVGNRARDRS